MVTGYVAFLDVLGFSALVSSEQGGRIERYLECLKLVFEADDERLTDYVVFSDSIIVTTKDDSDDSLQSLLFRCSLLLGLMLEHEIALRGAIAHGSYLIEKTNSGTFVAGRAIIDAYHFENAQDWVGIMLAPSVTQKVRDLEERCRYRPPSTPELLQDLTDRLPWAAFVQQCHAIPFHTAQAVETNHYDGFAIVPTKGDSDFAALRDSISAIRTNLARLKSFAPNPQAQQKYVATDRWLALIYDKWQMAESQRAVLAREAELLKKP